MIRVGIDLDVLKLELRHAGFQFEESALHGAESATEGDAQLRGFLCRGGAETTGRAGTFEGGLLEFLGWQTGGDFAQIAGYGAGGLLREMFVPALQMRSLPNDLAFDLHRR